MATPRRPHEIAVDEMIARMMEIYTTKGYRIVSEPWIRQYARQRRPDTLLWEVPCRVGGSFSPGRRSHLYVYGEGLLGFSGIDHRLLKRLLRVQNVQRHQLGDQEFSIYFPTSSLDAVASIVKPYRLPKRPRNPSRKAHKRLSSHDLHQGSPDPQGAAHAR